MSIKKSQAKCTENIGPPVILVFSTPLTGSRAEKKVLSVALTKTGSDHRTGSGNGLREKKPQKNVRK